VRADDRDRERRGGGGVHGVLLPAVGVPGGGVRFAVCPGAGRHAGAIGRERNRPTRLFKMFYEEKDLEQAGRAEREAGCAPDRACETDKPGYAVDPATGDLRSGTGAMDATTAGGLHSLPGCRYQLTAVPHRSGAGDRSTTFTLTQPPAYTSGITPRRPPGLAGLFVPRGDPA
jgi:hypothetical protein